jgi:hypothetical protein
VGTGAATRSDAAAPLTLTDFSDGAWVVHVDRTLRAGGPNVSFPTQPLSESDYEPSTTKPQYAVEVSMQAQRVSVGSTPWLGARAASDAQSLQYDFTQGAFAGGRFVVWQADSGLQAEVTLYGSGRPIVQSERGALVRSTH